MSTYIGIDYGLGKTNIEVTTGIRYGVINANSIMPEALDDFEFYYPEDLADDETDVFEPFCATYEKDGYIMEHNFDSNVIMIIKSPYTTKCAFCSPCYPGAGDLDSPRDEGILTYCLGPDWFEENKAPYICTEAK